jgi:SOS-response transcriptional repressor LexA
MSADEVFARITQRLSAMDLTERKASMLAVGNPDLIRNMKRNRSTAPQGRNLSRLARVLGVSETWLLTGEGQEEFEIPNPEAEAGVAFGGIVEAGAFRPIDLLNQDGEHRRVPLPPDPRFPSSSQFAFRVEGDSMVNANIHPGMYVLAVEFHTWEKLRGEPGDGTRVIVAHYRDGHPERELTVKTLRIFRDRLGLRPESPNPAHKPVIYPWPPTPDTERQTQLIAVVLAATFLFV